MFYYLDTVVLGKQFLEKGFLPHVARILFDPHGAELCRVGWNWLANNYIARTFKAGLCSQISAGSVAPEAEGYESAEACFSEAAEDKASGYEPACEAPVAQPSAGSKKKK